MTRSPSKVIDRYSTVSLSVLKEEVLPLRRDIPALLKRWGLSSQTQESFWVVAYDSARGIRDVIEIARGNYSKVQIHYASIYTAVLTAGCERFIVAHNHPGGIAKPTDDDISLTRGIMEGANACGLFFEDHWIVTPSGRSFSFTEHHLIDPADFEQVQAAEL